MKCPNCSKPYTKSDFAQDVECDCGLNPSSWDSFADEHGKHK